VSLDIIAIEAFSDCSNSAERGGGWINFTSRQL